MRSQAAGITGECDLGALLRRYREARGLLQEELAALVEPALSVTTIGNVERGRTRPHRHTLDTLAASLGLDANQRAELVAAWRAVGAEAKSPSAPAAGGVAKGMSSPPTGTLAILFTKVEGSPALLNAHPDAYRRAVQRYQRLVEQTVEDAGGVVFDRVEDGVYAGFARTADAAHAAVAGQLAVAGEDWGDTPIRVRMGLDLGAVEVRESRYFGAALYRCARLTSAAHGGQVVVSSAAAELVRDDLPAGASLQDLGEHRLKDPVRPEQVFQLVHPELPDTFPLWHSLVARPHNLPVQLGRFVGREQELAAITARLCSPVVRLLTLTGAGGIGKTRLALQAAAATFDSYADGVSFVSLASVSEPSLVLSAIAQALGVRDAGGSLRDSVRAFLHDKQLLLVLDNFEHLLAAAPLVPALLADAPGLNVLVTSREVLRVSVEHSLAVPPMRLPPRTALPPLEQLTQYEAVRLFIERAQVVKPDFEVTNANAPAVAEICHQLDGLPLAIELAAARVRHFAPEALFARLERRLSVLTGGPRDLPARQQTLRGAIAWSYDLLTPQEQALFRRLAVFAGGCTLEAAEAVCARLRLRGRRRTGTSLDVLDGIASLVDKSLLQHDAGTSGEPRYTTLQTVREYALEQLTASGEEPVTRARHAEYYEALAQGAAPHFLKGEQLAWLARMDDELDNLRGVLGWLLDHDERERGQLLAGSLWYFWGYHGPVSEGREWLTRMLAGPAGSATSALARAQALMALGDTAGRQYDLVAEAEAFSESLMLARAAGDARTTAMALVRMAEAANKTATWRDSRQQAVAGTPERALPGPVECYEEALAIFLRLGDDWGAAMCLAFYAQFLVLTDSARARNLVAEAGEIASRLGDRWAMAFSLGVLGRLAINAGEPTEARRVLEQSLPLLGELNDLFNQSFRLGALAQLEMDEIRFAEALALHERCVANYRLLGNRPRLAYALHDLAIVARLVGDANRALQAYEESLTLCQALGQPGEVAAVRASLGHLHREGGAFPPAKVAFAESARVLNSLGTELGITTVLCGLGWMALDAGRPTDAASLLGAAEALLERLQTGPGNVAIRLETSLRGSQFRRDITHARELRAAFESMDRAAFAGALDSGRALTSAAALSLGLEQAERSAEAAAVGRAELSSARIANEEDRRKGEGHGRASSSSAW